MLLHLCIILVAIVITEHSRLFRPSKNYLIPSNSWEISMRGGKRGSENCIRERKANNQQRLPERVKNSVWAPVGGHNQARSCSRLSRLGATKSAEVTWYEGEGRRKESSFLQQGGGGDVIGFSCDSGEESAGPRVVFDYWTHNLCLLRHCAKDIFFFCRK